MWDSKKCIECPYNLNEQGMSIWGECIYEDAYIDDSLSS